MTTIRPIEIGSCDILPRGARGGGRPIARIIGDGVQTEFDVVHGWNTRYVLAAAFENGNEYADIQCDITRPGLDRVRFRFSEPPLTDSIVVLVHGGATVP